MIPQVHSPSSYSPMYPPPHLSQPQISHSFVPPSQQYHSHMDHQTSYVLQISYHSPQASTQPMTEFSQIDSGLAIPVFSQGDDPIACLNKAMAFLITQFQGRQGQSYVGTSYKGNATSSGGNNAEGQTRMVKCYNCQGEGHMARQYEEQLVFLGNLGILESQVAQITIPNTAAFQTEDLDAYASNCDDVSYAKEVLMAN
ncbi:retrovirus-related pol polyprotein from transposon TNT 1-94, partial [Tanacetum coccineum]